MDSFSVSVQCREAHPATRRLGNASTCPLLRANLAFVLALTTLVRLHRRFHLDAHAVEPSGMLSNRLLYGASILPLWAFELILWLDVELVHYGVVGASLTAI